MTAKDKANIVAKNLVHEITNKLFEKGYRISKPLVIEIAVTCVNAKMESEKKYSNFGEYEFLQEVKQEIENL
jgi:hypothetical protein